MSMRVIYRIIEYSGPDDQLDHQLDSSMTAGEKKVGDVTIRVAFIDPDDKISIEIARNKFRQLEAKLTDESSSL